MANSVGRTVFRIEGIVQGVGFRPFVYRLAKSHRLSGRVWNAGEGVVVEVEGLKEEMRQFAIEVVEEVPTLALITKIQKNELNPKGYSNFEIIQSMGLSKGKVMVPPDITICNECKENINDSASRHYRYPFTNCTNCGPRFTIVRQLPYDREKTSMKIFKMCTDCAVEYIDPLDRRFHAQPVACPACGPQVELVDRHGQKVSGNWLEACQGLLKEGSIIALKSLGGFHLACDAQNEQAVRRLRHLKKRPHKPLAVMCRNLETTAEYCRLSAAEVSLLSSPASPIVILKKNNGYSLPRELSPGHDTLGVMLPYTPLHILLLDQGPPVLVMTSGNYSDMPLCVENREALENLGFIADYFLWHNRSIVNRCDDSVASVVAGKTQYYRRSRGYVPMPLNVPVDDTKSLAILGMGSDKKNTFCLLKGKQAFVSQHIGDLGTLEGEQNYTDSLQNFKALINAEPQLVVFDLHPEYRSSGLARKAEGVAHIAVQHHHAHLASCMADNYLNEQVIGVILDGTGYGTDGYSWGFEILRGDYINFEREFHLDYIQLPGGDNAVQNPWKTAVSYLLKYGGEKGHLLAKDIFKEKVKEIEVIRKAVKTGLNSPQAGSCGRLFDAISALLGICHTISYEGQAAVELSNLVSWPDSDKEAEFLAKSHSPYPFEIREGIIDPGLMVIKVIEDIKKGVPVNTVARHFHDTVIAMVVESVKLVGNRGGPNKVVFSGGSWQNHYLQIMTQYLLVKQGYEVFSHRNVPTNDGGLSLGQAMIGYWRCRENVSGCTSEGIIGR
ncbi:carbamoyltransferase HypF [Desulfosporosinus sp. Sb-LF]|uniref:carbamoyltransferase HypF n=1 Tax=Desulfosporosinus sp. Sb-LF TaxID=2560027 RepID=UPI001FB112CB|nr:carbamoyltransferase HypF [Desulfosporosinus sp. Sb-LF]